MHGPDPPPHPYLFLLNFLNWYLSRFKVSVSVELRNCFKEIAIRRCATVIKRKNFFSVYVPSTAVVESPLVLYMPINQMKGKIQWSD